MVGIAPGGADVDAVARDRIELVEIHHVLARLAVDPVDRRLDRQHAADDRGNPARRRGSRRSGNCRRSSSSTMRGPWRPSAGSSFSARASISVPRNDPELWPTMTISSASLLARDLDEVLRKAVDALVPFGALAVREFPGPDRVGQQIEQIGAGSPCISARCRAGRRRPRPPPRC